ncbi:MAG: FtsX-like permease family protein, partial [Terriglobales bacterium]
LLGLFMALIGVYGVIAYSASQRTHEIGVRMALGADRSQILGLIVRQGVVVTAAGIGIGLALAAMLAQALSSLLFGLRPLDPLTFGTATLLISAVALAASLVPARRAMRADPIAALRCE